MFNIKLENDNVIITFSLNTGNYDQKVNYKIDLTNKKYYICEEEWVELEWELAVDSIKDKIELLKDTISDKILNNKNVIISYKNEQRKTNKDCSLQIEKARKHLLINEKIQVILNDYKL